MTTEIGKLGLGGNLSPRVVRSPELHRVRQIRTPFGRVMLTRDRGDSVLVGDTLHSNLQAVVRGSDGRVKDVRDLGSGLITNAGVNVQANDPAWIGAATPFSALSAANFHLLGTGTTAAAATDIFCQTPIGAGSLTGSTNGFMTGTQTYVSPNKLQTVATFAINGTLAITEWALCMNNAATVSRTSAGSAPTNNTFTDTGATFTTAGNGLKAFTIEIASSVLNTPTTTVMGQILSNTATVLTLQGPSASAAWLTLANAVASVPGATIAYQIVPTALDHKVFAAINLSAGDSLQMTYVLTDASGG